MAANLPWITPDDIELVILNGFKNSVMYSFYSALTQRAAVMDRKLGVN